MSDEEIEDTYLMELERQMEEPEKPVSPWKEIRVYFFWVLFLSVASAFWWQVTK